MGERLGTCARQEERGDPGVRHRRIPRVHHPRERPPVEGPLRDRPIRAGAQEALPLHPRGMRGGDPEAPRGKRDRLRRDTRVKGGEADLQDPPLQDPQRRVRRYRHLEPPRQVSGIPEGEIANGMSVLHFLQVKYHLLAWSTSSRPGSMTIPAEG